MEAYLSTDLCNKASSPLKLDSARDTRTETFWLGKGFSAHFFHYLFAEDLSRGLPVQPLAKRVVEVETDQFDGKSQEIYLKPIGWLPGFEG
ncbi:hypothetical protein [Octadecabacter antarcticus]|uniref:hypothetical protein n=1 Tax=Octadecabacter antarcticus TaxID=1217908 RepID=UPI0005C46F3C|nr:hypothetical protein [Octadecabacter antarcticus]